MISVERARQLIRNNTELLPVKGFPVADALGCVLAKDIYSPVSLPPFHQSAMDGFAFRFSDFNQRNAIRIAGEVPAGKFFKGFLKPGEAVRIFTGAPVPDGADTVVVQEKASVEKGLLQISDEFIFPGANVRKKGSQMEESRVAMKSRTVITPGGIGYLAGMGITVVDIFRKPSISILVTGSELQKPGKKLGPGQVYESNSFALSAALRSIGLHTVFVNTVVDNEKKISVSLAGALERSDVVLVTGGISVGDYDFVWKALQQQGIENIFYKIKQRPGKPLYFGKQGKKLVFALPGNPASVLSCFYEYVFPSLRLMQGHTALFAETKNLSIRQDYRKKSGLSVFLKGKMAGDKVLALEGQESFMMSSFAEADCLIYLPEKKEKINSGDRVEVHVLPGI